MKARGAESVEALGWLWALSQGWGWAGSKARSVISVPVKIRGSGQTERAVGIEMCILSSTKLSIIAFIKKTSGHTLEK